jgi:threonine synthase
VSVREAMHEVARLARYEGIFACPESATTLAGLVKALASGAVRADERMVVVCTGSGLKSVSSMAEAPMREIRSSADIAEI